MNLPTNYPKFIQDLKARIANARLKAGLAVNRELILLYWHIGKAILERQEREGWGAKILAQVGFVRQGRIS